MIKSFLITMAMSALMMAQGPGFGPRPGGLGMGQAGSSDALKQFLGLTDAQVEQLAALRKSQPEAMKPFAEQIREKAQALREEMQKANPDSARVGQLTVEMKAIREQMRADREKAGEQAKALLTPEQQAKLAELEAARELAPAIRQAAGLGLIEGPAGAGRGAGPAMMGPGGAGPGLGVMGGRGARGARGPRL